MARSSFPARPADALSYDPIRRPCGVALSSIGPPPAVPSPAGGGLRGAPPPTLDQLADPDPVNPPVDDDFNMLAVADILAKSPRAAFPQHGMTGLPDRADPAGR
jgi:hypothetical protein